MKMMKLLIGNIDEYAHTHKWRDSHPVHHLAAEEVRSKSYEPKPFLQTLTHFTEEISFSFRPKIAVLIFGKHLAAIWQHFATEFLQADVSKWAFPANADVPALRAVNKLQKSEQHQKAKGNMATKNNKT